MSHPEAEPQDHFNVFVIHFENIGGPPEAMHPVGLSHLKDYIEIMAGPDVPVDPAARFLGERLMGSLAEFSLDSDLHEMRSRATLEFVPRWLQRIEPIVDSAKGASSYIEHTLVSPADKKIALDNDAMYMLAIHDIAALVLSAQLAIDYPRLEAQGLVERAQELTSPDRKLAPRTNSYDVLGFYLIAKSIKAEHGRKMGQLRRQGCKITANSIRHLRAAGFVINLPEESQAQNDNR